MYQVTADGTVIHGGEHKLRNAKVKYKRNAIASFTFDIYPQNPGYDALSPFATIVEVRNTQDGSIVFEGRVLVAAPAMDAKGIVKKTVTCEHVEAYLLDSQQLYVEPRTWDNVRAFVAYALEVHNAHVPSHKQVQVGSVDVPTFKYSDALYKGIPRGNTWEILHAQLTKSYGGEMRVRRTGGTLYLDYGLKLGTTRSTTVELGKNIKSAKSDPKPGSIITRLYPYGCKITIHETDDEGNETERESEERLTIEDANGGVPYIEDSAAVAKYGIVEGYHEWDDVTKPENLLSKAREWLTDNNAIPIANTISALDLSAIGLDPDKFQFLDWYRCVNPLIGLDDTLEIVEHTIDVTNPSASTFGVGEVTETASGNAASLNGLSQKIEVIESQMKTNVVNLEKSITTTTTALLVMDGKIESTVKEVTNSVVTETIRDELGNLDIDSATFVLHIESSNGTVFPDGVIETTLTARVWHSAKELTAEGVAALPAEVVWYFNGREAHRGMTLVINAGDVADRTTVSAQLEANGGEE